MALLLCTLLTVFVIVILILSLRWKGSHS